MLYNDVIQCILFLHGKNYITVKYYRDANYAKLSGEKFSWNVKRG